MQSETINTAASEKNSNAGTESMETTQQIKALIKVKKNQIKNAYCLCHEVKIWKDVERMSEFGKILFAFHELSTHLLALLKK